MSKTKIVFFVKYLLTMIRFKMLDYNGISVPGDLQPRIPSVSDMRFLALGFDRARLLFLSGGFLV